MRPLELRQAAPPPSRTQDPEHDPQGGEDLRRRRRKALLLQLLHPALVRALVRAPAQQARAVPEAVAADMVIRHFHHQLGTQRLIMLGPLRRPAARTARRTAGETATRQSLQPSRKPGLVLSRKGAAGASGTVKAAHKNRSKTAASSGLQPCRVSDAFGTRSQQQPAKAAVCDLPSASGWFLRCSGSSPGCELQSWCADGANVQHRQLPHRRSIGKVPTWHIVYRSLPRLLAMRCARGSAERCSICASTATPR